MSDERGIDLTTNQDGGARSAEQTSTKEREEYGWFKGSVDRDLLREFIRLEAESKLST